MVRLPVSPTHDPLKTLRRWIDRVEPRRPAVAKLLVRLIPGTCPFERDVSVLGHRVFHIPPMCKLNPLYEEVAALRFRCLNVLETSESGPTQT